MGKHDVIYKTGSNYLNAATARSHELRPRATCIVISVMFGLVLLDIRLMLARQQTYVGPYGQK